MSGPPAYSAQGPYLGPTVAVAGDMRPISAGMTIGIQPENLATAPPLDQLTPPPGYESATFTSVPLQPPPYSAVANAFSEYPEQQVADMVPFSEKDARDALADFIDDHCCYSSKPVKNMDIKEIHMRPAFHYKLETFTERRETCWAFEPYEGQPIDGPHCGPPPGPWDIYVAPSRTFENSDTKLEVPHTAFVRMCHRCTGTGKIVCKKCAGQGRKRCWICHGVGRRETFDETRPCNPCSGSGWETCNFCHTRGLIKCDVCLSFGQIKCFVQLIVFWKNNVDEFVIEDRQLPEELIKDVTGTIVFNEHHLRVQPLARFPDQRIIAASRQLVSKHATQFKYERILEQRHSVKLVPVATINYHWKKTDGEFFLYGLDHKVYFPDYPSKCCCCSGCTIF